MNQTRCIVILSILALFVASVSVAGNISLPDASQKVFEIKIAEFAIILELNGYSDCLKIR